MMHPFKALLAAAVMGGVATVPTISQAESSKPEATSAKSESMSAANKNQASTDDFEENRRTHMQKSKENNAKKGEN